METDLTYNCPRCRIEKENDYEALFFMEHLDKEHCVRHWNYRVGALDNQHPSLRRISIKDTVNESLWFFAKRTLNLPMDIITEFLEERNFIQFCHVNYLEIPHTLKWTLAE